TNKLPDGLLTSVTNPLGGTTTIGYTPSTAWANTGPMPLVRTVTSLAASDGRGNTSTTTYSYARGLFDPLERKFLGFRQSVRTLPCNAGETTCPTDWMYFKQDYGSVSKPEYVYRYSGAAPLTVTIYEYTTNGATVPYTSLGSGTWNYTY